MILEIRRFYYISFSSYNRTNKTSQKTKTAQRDAYFFNLTNWFTVGWLGMWKVCDVYIRQFNTDPYTKLWVAYSISSWTQQALRLLFVTLFWNVAFNALNLTKPLQLLCLHFTLEHTRATLPLKCLNVIFSISSLSNDTWQQLSFDKNCSNFVSSTSWPTFHRATPRGSSLSSVIST